MSVMVNEPVEYELSAWDLSELLPEPSEEEIARHTARLEESVAAFEQVREELSSEMDPARLVEILGSTSPSWSRSTS